MRIVNIPAEKFFYVNDGTVIRHLAELPDALRNMSPDTFNHHVNEQKNDFYNWVGDVFEHSRLARKIKPVRRKETMAKHVFIEMFT
ncbi:MAG: hypothetical protein KKF46_07375 [Nanoarchaeota archaeon]|nr:hypothetical protein [Nanoarchaeota archaeon]MBU1322149.1 hypothetical protein [Nanoarchaeota archaeon]MBU1597870.1 hypothetical protein [Nanoarchaeota archaeon]MBU2441289.1 hypothetical protein [Nanoarchaeota archaeon]